MARSLVRCSTGYTPLKAAVLWDKVDVFSRDFVGFSITLPEGPSDTPRICKSVAPALLSYWSCLQHRLNFIPGMRFRTHDSTTQHDVIDVHWVE